MTEVFGDSKRSGKDPARVYPGSPAYGRLENFSLLKGK